MTKIYKFIFYLVSFTIFTNQTFAADRYSSSSLSTLKFKDDVLFLRTGNILNLKDQQILDEPDKIITIQRKSKLQNLLSKYKDDFQVHPGTENPSIGFNNTEGRVICNNNNCRNVGLEEYTKINALGKKEINYSLEGFQSVGIVVIYKPNNETEVCNFVVISPESILTAKHCVENNIQAPRAWLLMRLENILNPSLPLKFDGCINVIDLGDNCTFHKLKLSERQLTELWEDSSDLALLKLDTSSFPNEFSYDSIPQLDFSNSKFDIVTLVGNGKSNIDNYRSRRPLVGWFKGNYSYDFNIVFLDSSSTETKPAQGDSGSPLYRGEYFGRKCNTTQSKECSPYLLSAIVTGGIGANNEKIKDTVGAMRGKTKVIRLSNYKEFICSSSSGNIKGC